jgi:hypothetical protein
VAGAEVDRGCRRGIGDVLGVLDSATVDVDAHNAPRTGKELHRTHGAVVGGVPVQQAMVGVGDQGGPVRTVQPGPDDARPGYAGRVQLIAPEAGMIALDSSDGSQQCPVDVAGRVG